MEYRENDLQGLCRRAKAISHITIQRNECINIWNMEAVWITVEPLLSQCPKGSTGRKEIVVCLYAIAFFYPFTFTNSMCQIEPNEIANKWSFFNLKLKGNFIWFNLMNVYVYVLEACHRMQSYMSYKNFILPPMQQENVKKEVQIDCFQIHYSLFTCCDVPGVYSQEDLHSFRK